MENYYDILEISRNASDEVIKSAYKALVKKYHPDNCDGKIKDKELSIINEAYEILSDPIKKKEYDAKLSFGDFQEHTNQEQAYQDRTCTSTANMTEEDFYDEDPEMDEIARNFLNSKPLRFFKKYRS